MNSLEYHLGVDTRPVVSITGYDKLLVSMRYFLLGKGYYRACNSLEFGLSVHTGTRKDGITPEFMHQLAIMHYVRTLLPALMYPEDTLSACALHDTPEDYNIEQSKIESIAGERATAAVFLLDKNGKIIENQFKAIALDPVASIAKGGDRIHNTQTMVGVFKREKQRKYAAEIPALFFPMLKQARRLFPQQEPAYQNIKHVLVSQLQLLSAIFEAEDAQLKES